MPARIVLGVQYDSLASELGSRIRQLRRGRDMSQEQLAEAVRLSPVHLGRIERGATNPTLRNLWRIAEALEVPTAALFDGDGVQRAKGP